MKCHEPAIFCAALLNSQPLGFYAPAQLINEAKKMGAHFRSVDVAHSDWDRTPEPGDDGKAEVRLGLQMIRGLPEIEGQCIAASRASTPYISINDVVQRASLTKRAVNALAEGGALASLAGHRHQSRWIAAGTQRVDGLLADAEPADTGIPLQAPREAQDIVADYHSLGLTLGRHPLALLRKKPARMRVVTTEQLRHIEDGEDVTVAGIVTHRQRPGTASGVVFATLEDEIGTVNLIIWPKVLEAQREAIFGAQLMVVRGRLQSEQGVIHVITHVAEDRSALLGALSTGSRDFH